MIEKKNGSIAAKIEYLEDETQHYSSEIGRLERLKNEYESDAEYLNNRLDELNKEKIELEAMSNRQTCSTKES
jgi:prefoldin subunit 5